MSVTSDTDRAGAETDPAQLRDKPLSWPPAGNPRVFGPGRARPVDRAMILLGGAFMAFCVLWLTRLKDGYDIWPGFDALTRTDLAIYLVIVLIMAGAGYISAIYPPQRIILRVDDSGLTLRSLKPNARGPSFIPFELLASVKLSRIPKSSDHTIQIEMRPGARWRSCVFSARSATGTQGPEIAAEIARRASAAGVAVTLCERPGHFPGRMLWSFAQPDKAGVRGQDHGPAQ